MSIRIAVIVSRFNPEVTEGLYQGAVEVLVEHQVQFDPVRDRYSAPGAFELPLLAQALIQKKHYDGVVALGCVIKGDTAHFEFISLGAAVGMQMASLQNGKPISFGILTTYTDDQAVIRSRPGPENKGREAALACLESIQFIHRLK